MINISKILKDAPQGMKLYSPLFGEVRLVCVNCDNNILVETEMHDEHYFAYNGVFRMHGCYPHSECLLFPSKECRDWETWLLPTKPMFKVGDWVVDQTFAGPEGYIGEVGIIEGVTMLGDAKKENYYAIRGTDGKLLGGTDGLVCEHYLRPWAIEDAKDGDALVCYSEVKGIPIEQVGIFKRYVGRHGGCSNTFLTYTGIDWDGNIIINGYMGSTNILPATKEQRNLLFQKMKEAGYQWDADKKELKKIKPHYDISNFHAGMPVLVRETSLNAWQYVPFSHCYIVGDGSTRFNAGLVGFTQCIPFEGNEHLLGTTNMPDECYINWRL